jgi:transcriptional regulator with PAS, ATPase and Fis domain
MDPFTELLQDSGFARTLIDAIPCGMLVMDEEGHVQAVNHVVERVFGGLTGGSAVNVGSGDVLRCLEAVNRPEGCGAGELCEDCGIRRLALNCFSSKEQQKARTYHQLIVEGQIRDVTLLLGAVPFTAKDGRPLCILLLEDITGLGATPLPDAEGLFWGMVGRDEKMLRLFETIRRVATTNAPVLIQGESGTGKELVALALHRESRRAENYFVPVNCAALPEALMESELFGHAKGAFTGAVRDKKGRFELADGGSIFLDEVGELGPAVQGKLLRVLPDGCFEPVGSERTVRVDVRVISATNKDLAGEVEAGRFRLDLYHRLCVMPITVPPLRDRGGDIPVLAAHFLSQYCEESWRDKVRLSARVLSLLTAYSWPGNVRELQNVLQYALLHCQGSTIELEHLPESLSSTVCSPPGVRHREPKLEAKDVARALKAAGGNRKQAARLLGVSRSTLYRFFDRTTNDRNPS